MATKALSSTQPRRRHRSLVIPGFPDGQTHGNPRCRLTMGYCGTPFGWTSRTTTRSPAYPLASTDASRHSQMQTKRLSCPPTRREGSAMMLSTGDRRCPPFVRRSLHTRTKRTIGAFVSIDVNSNGPQRLTFRLEGLAPATPKKSRAVAEWYSAGGTLMPVSPASSTEMSPLGQQIMANVRRKRYGN